MTTASPSASAPRLPFMICSVPESFAWSHGESGFPLSDETNVAAFGPAELHAIFHRFAVLDDVDRKSHRRRGQVAGTTIASVAVALICDDIRSRHEQAVGVVEIDLDPQRSRIGFTTWVVRVTDALYSRPPRRRHAPTSAPGLAFSAADSGISTNTQNIQARP